MSEPCTGNVFDLAMPTPKRAQKKVNALAAKPHDEHHHREDRGRPADDRRAPVAVGEPAHRQRAEHEERARRRADEDDDAVADVRSVSRMFGASTDKRRGLELVERLEQHEDDEREDAAVDDAFAQRDAARRRRREGDRRRTGRLASASACSRLTLGLGVEHDLHQARSRRPAVFRLGTRHVLSPSKELAPTARV